MKASVQYNDLKGSSAADYNDSLALDYLLQGKNFDKSKYQPIGLDFYMGYDDFFTYSIICKDLYDNNKIVNISFEDTVTSDEFFKLFKRLNVVLINKGIDASDLQISKDIHL